MTIFPDQVAAQLCTQFQQSGFKSTYLVCSFYPPTVKQIISIMKISKFAKLLANCHFPQTFQAQRKAPQFLQTFKDCMNPPEASTNKLW